MQEESKKNLKQDMKKNSSIILGIDPGTRVTGYGIIKVVSTSLYVLDFGCIRPSIKLNTAQKYLALFNALDLIIEKYCPDYVAVESQFIYKNAKSAMTLGKAQGTAIVAAARRNVPVEEYAPTQAKLAVVGKGSASKQQVQKMLQLIFSLPSIPEPEDAADALALAVCHANALHFKTKL